MARFTSFRRLICPSTGLVDQGRSMAACTAALSFAKLRANPFSGEEAASANQPSSVSAEAFRRMVAKRRASSAARAKSGASSSTRATYHPSSPPMLSPCSSLVTLTTVGGFHVTAGGAAMVGGMPRASRVLIQYATVPRPTWQPRAADSRLSTAGRRQPSAQRRPRNAASWSSIVPARGFAHRGGEPADNQDRTVLRSMPSALAASLVLAPASRSRASSAYLASRAACRAARRASVAVGLKDPWVSALCARRATLSRAACRRAAW
jgi:hypothetical protein